MKNSRNKQFTSLKLRVILSSVTKSPKVPLRPSRDVNHHLVQLVPPVSHLVALLQLSD